MQETRNAGLIPGSEDPLEEAWQLTPVFLPRDPHGQRSLVGCSPWGRTESDTTEATQQQQQLLTYIL